jgi:neutral ceramidase
MRRWLFLGLSGCVKDDWTAPPPPEPIEEGAPSAGAAEGYLKLPVGTPLSGYTSRCSCLGSTSKQDDRASPYTVSFVESTGVQTYPTIKVIWLQNGDDNLVITKTDSIYSFDGLVQDLAIRLEQETGETLAGRVVHTTNHSHSSWGTYNHGITWYLGSDRFNRENYERMLDQIVQVALEAYGTREPAKLGVGWATDWDPADTVYRDRRGENDTLAPWGPDGPQKNGVPGLGKDPHLGVVRFDTLDDRPLAVMVNFGMHGILGSESNPLVSSDSGGHLEIGLEQSYGADKVVVMFTQGAGGDVSPAGDQDDYAAMESIGVKATDKLRALIDTVPTSADPIRMETASRAILKHPSNISVTRAGDVDWQYAPFDDDPGFVPDNLVYGPNGEILSPIDEFNTQTGAVFCGSGDLDFPIGGLAATVFPYDQCLQVDLLSSLIKVFFQLEEVPLPLPETLRAGTTASRLGPISTLRADGSVVSQDLFVGFFPGEPVHSYAEQWRRRVEDELGLQDAMIVGYSQDHEGYLLIPEDWLVGGYEPDIGVWGPLEAEHVMEGVLAYSQEALLTTDVREQVDPFGRFGPTPYEDVPLPVLQPDPTPDAGARITAPGPYLWTPFLDLDDEDEPQAPTPEELAIPSQLPRVQGLVQIAWEGGDPMVDSPHVVLEREEEGQWVAVTTPAGRLVDEGRHDILLGHTPTPLYPADAVQTHQWWAAWQAVSHWEDRTGLPLGRYRLHVTGQRYGGSATTWPWDGVPYDVVSEPFEVVPGELTVTLDGESLLVSMRAPEHGYRYVAPGGDEDGDNPIAGPATVQIDTGTGLEEQLITPEPADPWSRLAVTLPESWLSLTVTDAHGNTGTLIRPE